MYSQGCVLTTRSFKSVGTLKTARKFAKGSVADPRPIGIKTPLRAGDGRTDLFDCHFFMPETIQDNLKNLILTNSGERLGKSSFGADLRELTTELTAKESFETEAMLRISLQVEKFMPYIELETFETDLMQEGNVLRYAESDLKRGLGKITLTLKYNVPNLNVMNRTLKVNIYCVG
jgi:phage baseplate assembly protein W